MAQEFTIKSAQIEDKINQLLPSQGGFQAGVDFSASTMVIPVVDLTETAEGSSLRQDLQTCFSHNSLTVTQIVNTTSTIINTTGYYRVFGTAGNLNSTNSIAITDGTTPKNVFNQVGSSTTFISELFDFIVLLEAGDSLTGTSASTGGFLDISTRQIADLAKNLVNP
jgi:hypothetical protein